MKAHEFLEAGLGHMKDRAATYDKPQGERSMNATVGAFAAITGHALTEEQGWLFMCLLKAVRAQSGAYKADNYEDLAAYAGLMGESASAKRDQAVELWTEAEERRMDVIGQNGPTAEHYLHAFNESASFDPAYRS